MPKPPRRPSYDVAFLLPGFAVRFSRLRAMAVPLRTHVGPLTLQNVDIYYRAESDLAVMLIRVDASRVTGRTLALMEQDANYVGAVMMEVPKMAATDREKFIEQQLASYDVHLAALPGADAAMDALAEKLGMALPHAAPKAAPTAIEARFRRGDTWHRGRLCHLGNDSLSIATGGAPRVGDLTDLELSGGGKRVQVRIEIVEVTPTHSQMAGAPGFGARFVFRDAAERRRLAGLALMLRDLAPPPPRCEVRFPLSWPAVAALGGDALPLRLTDVSRSGMCVATRRPLHEQPVSIYLPIDRRCEPAELRGRIVRVVAGEPGFGLQLEDASATAAERYRGFVDRVGQRGRKRVVIGAKPPRLGALVAEFGGAGYVVVGAAEPRALWARATEDGTPPDLTVIDGSLDDYSSRVVTSVQRALHERQHPAVRVDGESPGYARTLADERLVA